MITTTRRTARAIRLDKPGIRELAKELEVIVADALEGREGPLGKEKLGQHPFEIQAVDGSRQKLWILLQAIPSRDFRYFVSGGIGTAGGKPVLVVDVNGSLDAEVIWKATNARTAHGFLYPILLHELTHAADIFAPELGMTEDEAHGNAAYYNHPSELRAYMQEVVDELEERFPYFDKLRGRFGHRGLEMFLNMSSTWKEVSPHWTAASRQKVLKAVYQALDDWRDREAARKVVAAYQMPTRVVERYIGAKGKAKQKSLVPEYTKAMKALEDGDEKPLLAWMESTARIILPVAGGTLPDWFNALGTVKRNAIMGLYKEFGSFNRSLDALPPAGDPKRQFWIDYLVKQAKPWGRAVRTLEIASAVTDTTLEIKHGPFTVVPVPGITKKLTDGALEALDAAVAKVKPKCPRVLYGKLFLTTTLQKGAAAKYVGAHDALYLNVLARKRFDDIVTIIHELGHRHDAKFLSKEGREKYWELSTREVRETLEFDSKRREEMADEVVALTKLKALGKPVPSPSYELVWWLKSAHPHWKGDVRNLTTNFLNGFITEKDLHTGVKGKTDAKVRTDKIVTGPLHVTPYGGTSPAENYADGFAHYILGMDMPPELAAILAEEVI